MAGPRALSAADGSAGPLRDPLACPRPGSPTFRPGQHSPRTWPRMLICASTLGPVADSEAAIGYVRRTVVNPPGPPCGTGPWSRSTRAAPGPRSPWSAPNRGSWSARARGDAACLTALGEAARGAVLCYYGDPSEAHRRCPDISPRCGHTHPPTGLARLRDLLAPEPRPALPTAPTSLPDPEGGHRHATR